jgi:hypothetical protein
MQPVHLHAGAQPHALWRCNIYENINMHTGENNHFSVTCRGGIKN